MVLVVLSFIGVDSRPRGTHFIAASLEMTSIVPRQPNQQSHPQGPPCVHSPHSLVDALNIEWAKTLTQLSLTLGVGYVQGRISQARAQNPGKDYTVFLFHFYIFLHDLLPFRSSLCAKDNPVFLLCAYGLRQPSQIFVNFRKMVGFWLIHGFNVWRNRWQFVYLSIDG